jgi:aspartyl-tRNA(Asn)/glutamyl-tRNA(Gln) amidotransferase subunit A
MIGIAAVASAPFDALIMPTVPMIAPEIAALQSDPALALKTNMTLIRNCVLANFLDRCSVTIPCHEPDQPPVGFMLIGETMADRRVLSVARALERVLDDREP